MKKVFPIIFVCFLFLIVAGLAKAAQPAQVYITQVQTTGGAGKTDQDFVELFNPGDAPVNLKGYRLVKRSTQATSDTLIKSWSSDALIPPKSFYLWANSSYTSIPVKPDAATSATLSDDNGVALRFGADNAGQLIDALSWGKANNGFPSVTGINPYGGQAIFRQDWYSLISTYFIATSKPHNSQTSDFTAAYASSVASQSQTKNPSTPSPQPTGQVPVPTGSTASPQPQGEPTSTPAETISTGQNQPSYGYQTPTKSNNAAKYLYLAGAALLVLVFLAYQFLFKKKK